MSAHNTPSNLPPTPPRPAPQVHESISAPGLLSPAALAHYDSEGAEALLYELRFLSVRQRAPAAQYIADNDLGWAGLWVGGWAGGS